METIKKAIGILLSVLLWAIILVTALFTFTTLATKDKNSVARLAGFTPLIVKSDSMAPVFHAGDLIIIKTCDVKTLKKGDIITFHTIINNEYALNTHRIERINEDGNIRNFITKGDNNSIEDTSIVSDTDVVGIYVGKIPILGRLMIFLSSSTGFLLVIVLPMLLFFIYQVYHLVMVSINLKKAIAVEAAEEKARREQELENQRSSDADVKLAEAQAALAEAKRLKEEAEAKLAQAQNEQAAKAEEAEAALAQAQDEQAAKADEKNTEE